MSVSECLSVLRKTLELTGSSPPDYMTADITEKCILPNDIPRGIKEDALKVVEMLSKWGFDYLTLRKGCSTEMRLRCPTLYNACTQPAKKDGEEFVSFLRNVLERWSVYE